MKTFAQVFASLKFADDFTAAELHLFKSELKRAWNKSDDARILLDGMDGTYRVWKTSNGSYADPFVRKLIHIDPEDYRSRYYVDDTGHWNKISAAHLLVHELFHAITGKDDGEGTYGTAKPDYVGPAVRFTNKVLLDLGEEERVSFSAQHKYTEQPVGSYTQGEEIDRAILAHDRARDALANLDFSTDAKASRDLMIGNSRSNSYNGGSEADFLYGMGGKDTLKGSGGDDYLEGGAGRDTLLGGIGKDLLVIDAGHDTADGGAGADTYVLFAGATADIRDTGSESDLDAFFFTNLEQGSFDSVERSYFVGDGRSEFTVRHDGWYDFQPSFAPNKSMLGKSRGVDLHLDRSDPDARVAVWLVDGRRDVVHADRKDDLDNVGLHGFETGRDKIDLSELDYDRLFRSSEAFSKFQVTKVAADAPEIDVLIHNGSYLVHRTLAVRNYGSAEDPYFVYASSGESYFLGPNAPISDYIF